MSWLISPVVLIILVFAEVILAGHASDRVPANPTPCPAAPGAEHIPSASTTQLSIANATVRAALP
jgi:hypothetical protein